MTNVSFQCPTEFNVVTNLKSCNDYLTEMKESAEMFKYRFDIRPGPMCYMPGQNFQGLQSVVARNPPPQLLETERALTMLPLKEERNDYFIKDLHGAKPQTPTIFRNRMVVPDCRDILTWQRTKIRRIDFPQVSQRMDRMGFYLTNYMRPGRDTKAEMKDAYKRYEQMKNANSNIYGVGIFDRGALKPDTTTKCTNAAGLECMNIYGSGTPTSSTILDPTLTLQDLSARQGLPASTPTLPTPTSALAKNAARSIDSDVPYTELLQDTFAKNSCNARFYNYKPSGC